MPAWKNPIPDAVPLGHDLVPLLEGPVPPALGYIRLLEGFLQLLAQSLALLSKDFSLLIGSPGIHCHCVFDLLGVRGKQRAKLLGLLALKCSPTSAGLRLNSQELEGRKLCNPSYSPPQHTQQCLHPGTTCPLMHSDPSDTR